MVASQRAACLTIRGSTGRNRSPWNCLAGVDRRAAKVSADRHGTPGHSGHPCCANLLMQRGEITDQSVASLLVNAQLLHLSEGGSNRHASGEKTVNLRYHFAKALRKRPSENSRSECNGLVAHDWLCLRSPIHCRLMSNRSWIGNGHRENRYRLGPPRLPTVVLTVSFKNSLAFCLLCRSFKHVRNSFGPRDRRKTPKARTCGAVASHTFLVRTS